MQKKSEKIIDIIKKDYNNKLEAVLEKKYFDENVKSILLSILYKIETSYKDYKHVKQGVETKEEFIERIINTIKDNPNKAEKLDTFFDYYLPMVLKILTKYDNIENQGLSSAEQKKFMASAKKMLSEATLSFDKVLNNLYQAELIDADADMKVFNTMLKSDGIDTEEIEVQKKEKKDEQE